MAKGASPSSCLSAVIFAAVFYSAFSILSRHMLIIYLTYLISGIGIAAVNKFTGLESKRARLRNYGPDYTACLLYGAVWIAGFGVIFDGVCFKRADEETYRAGIFVGQSYSCRRGYDIRFHHRMIRLGKMNMRKLASKKEFSFSYGNGENFCCF